MYPSPSNTSLCLAVETQIFEPIIQHADACKNLSLFTLTRDSGPGSTLLLVLLIYCKGGGRGDTVLQNHVSCKLHLGSEGHLGYSSGISMCEFVFILDINLGCSPPLAYAARRLISMREPRNMAYRCTLPHTILYQGTLTYMCGHSSTSCVRVVAVVGFGS